MTYGTIQVRFFSGEKVTAPRATYYGAYGHFGMCSLLAIRRVVDSDYIEHKDLDYHVSPNQPEDKYLGVGRGYKDLETENVLEIQRRAEQGEKVWSFGNPQKVAIDYLSRTLKIPEGQIIGLKQIRKSNGRFFYYWKNKGTKDTYFVNVSRPYWLSYYAKDRQKIAWVVTGAYKLT